MLGTIGFIVSCIAVPIIYGAQQHDYHKRAKEAMRDYAEHKERTDKIFEPYRKMEKEMHEEALRKNIKYAAKYYDSYIFEGYAQGWLLDFYEDSLYCIERPLPLEDLQFICEYYNLINPIRSCLDYDAYSPRECNACIAFKRNFDGLIKDENGDPIPTTERERLEIMEYSRNAAWRYYEDDVSRLNYLTPQAIKQITNEKLAKPENKNRILGKNFDPLKEFKSRLEKKPESFEKDLKNSLSKWHQWSSEEYEDWLNHVYAKAHSVKYSTQDKECAKCKSRILD